MAAALFNHWRVRVDGPILTADLIRVIEPKVMTSNCTGPNSLQFRCDNLILVIFLDLLDLCFPPVSEVVSFV